MPHGQAKAVADAILGVQLHPREYSIAELLAGSEQLAELLADGDYARLSGSAIRRATTVNELQAGVNR